MAERASACLSPKINATDPPNTPSAPALRLSRMTIGRQGRPVSRLRGDAMTLILRLDLIVALAAFVFVAAIVLGAF
jgi:hypothetical protein